MKRKKRSVHPIRQRARELRQRQTPAEARLWQHLRRKQLNGLYFRRQHPAGSFIVDCYCTGTRLVVEVDGDGHVFQENYDASRTEWLEEQKYRVIRLTNRQVFQELEAVLAHILRVCKQ